MTRTVPDPRDDAPALYPRDTRIEQLVLDRAARTPRSVAVADGTSLTYAQLADWSAGIANRLEVSPGDVVALHLSRGAAFAAAALAVLRAGAVYMPVDPDHPDERVAYLLQDAGAVAVLSSAADAQRAALRGARVIDPCECAEAPGTPRPHGTAATDPAYLMYTSGTTGRPKGVLVPHRAVVRLAHDATHAHLGPDTVMAHIGATSFDASVWELWGTLINGGTLQVLSRETVLDPDEFGQAIATHAITTGLVTSALFSHLADADPGMFAPMRDLLVGGDVLSATHAQAVLAACPNLRLVNAYGPTENGVISTVHQVVPGKDHRRVPIGLPIDNSSALVVTDEGHLQRPGLPGELWVGGDGLAVGYHRRPQLTAAAFVEASFAPGERFYRTGDRVVCRPDGAIEFVGRADGQIKVRGQRVELGEVENLLIGVDGVEEAVVLADKSVPGEPVLRAFVTGTATAGQVRADLSRRVPEHLVPSSVTVMARFPLTGHGKVDRQALGALVAQPDTDPDPRARTAGTVSLTPAQEQVAQIWRRVVGVEEIAPGDTLTQLGGSSLAATRIAGLLRAGTGRTCRVMWVLRDDLATLTTRLEQAPPVPARPTGAQNDAPSTLPLLPQQSAVLTEALLRPGDLGYNLPVVVEIPGHQLGLDIAGALARLRDRHEALRTTLVAGTDGQWRQRVGPVNGGAVPFEVLRAPGDDLETVLHSWVRPFDLEAGPLWRAALVSGPTRQAMAIDAHHLIADGWSLRVLLEDLTAARQSAVPSYGELVCEALSQQMEQPERRAAFARQPGPDLPLDRPRPPLRSTAGAWVRHPLGLKRTRAVRALAQDLGAPPFAVYLTALGVVLARVTGSPRPTVAVPFSGRHVAGGEHAVGMLVATHTLDVPVAPETSFPSAVRELATTAAETADLPQPVQDAGHGGRRDRHPVADVLFAFQDTGLGDVDVAGGRPRWLPELTGAVLFDLALHIEPRGEGDEALWGFASAILDAGTVHALHTELTDVLDAAVSDPHRPVGSLGAPAPSAAVRPDFVFDL
ncbi:non-ribosomal peptide synthetase [Kineosporia babensis]|uniref:Amino acid adenylation domain-containing protein n=1 Tax=Kineosporia babensis TaxID=499548 RepID=A0A9X1NIB2_9ACTN|nr:non-ribosomal peptide synthetase [Kineosporia babensis]MCD5314354.1 amino acid adenylation domain-containing protein [Kineosporia babensis]